MFLSAFILIIVGCSSLLWPAVDGIWHQPGVRNSYCIKADLYPNRYPLPRKNCCKRFCSDFIESGNTKYGLYHEDRDGLRVACKCDADLYACLTKNQNLKTIQKVRESFVSEWCFDAYHEDCLNGHCIPTQWEFYPSLTRVPMTKTQRFFFRNLNPTNSSSPVKSS